jgi:hypothetical protein
MALTIEAWPDERQTPDELPRGHQEQPPSAVASELVQESWSVLVSVVQDQSAPGPNCCCLYPAFSASFRRCPSLLLDDEANRFSSSLASGFCWIVSAASDAAPTSDSSESCKKRKETIPEYSMVMDDLFLYLFFPCMCVCCGFP